MHKMILLVLVATLLLGGSALAARKSGGLAISYATPKGDFQAVVDDGWGASAIFDYPFAGVLNISGSLGWYGFSGITIFEGTNVKTDTMTMWEFSAGPQADFGKLYLGVEAGYYTNLDEWGVVPNVGFRKDLIDVNVRYKMTGDGEFMAFRLGFFF